MRLALLLFCPHTDIEECASQPCVFGQCIDGIGGFTCVCQAGYTGSLCDSSEFSSFVCVFSNCLYLSISVHLAYQSSLIVYLSICLLFILCLMVSCFGLFVHYIISFLLILSTLSLSCQLFCFTKLVGQFASPSVTVPMH